MSDPVSAPVGTAYERAVAALARAPRRPRLVIILPENTLFRGSLVEVETDVDAYVEAASVERAQVVAALHAATDIALALIARTDAPAAAARALSRARIEHAFATTRYLPPRLPSRAAAAAALVTALHDVRGATGVALSDALLLDDGTLGAAEVAALGVTLHQVEGFDGLVADDLETALHAFCDNADAARGF